MFVKICGNTNEQDALFSVAMGADAVGFVFAPSPRQVAPPVVRDIIRRIPAEILTVGVFRDEAAQRVVEITNTTGLSAVQLHGHETPAEAAWIRERVPLVIKAVSIDDYGLDRVLEFEAADIILIDASSPGSGEPFDWSLLEGFPLGKRLVVAGGLTPDNVGDAIDAAQPWGVDVVSGVEATPGYKDPRKVFHFLQEAKAHEAPSFDGDDLIMPFDIPFDVDYEDELAELAD